MKLLQYVVFIVSLLLVCACTPSTKKTTVIDNETLQKRLLELKNTSITATEMAWANLQGVPIPAVNISRVQLESMIRKSRVKIVEKHDGYIIVRGKKKVSSGESTLWLDKVDSFIYKFESGLMVSGPNIVPDK